MSKFRTKWLIPLLLISIGIGFVLPLSIHIFLTWFTSMPLIEALAGIGAVFIVCGFALVYGFIMFCDWRK